MVGFFLRNRRCHDKRHRRRRRIKNLPLLVVAIVSIFVLRAFLVYPSRVFTPQGSLRSKSPASKTTTTTAAISQPIGGGWQRIKPSHGGNVYGELDPLTMGKSCQWQPTRFYYPKKLLSYIFFASRRAFLGAWICRDCGTADSEYASWESCPLLKPRGKCPSIEYQGWEDPRPRSTSTYDPLSSSPYPVRLITSYGVGKVRRVEYEQPQCQSLREPCFDIHRCNNRSKTIPVFAYPGRAQQDLKDAKGTLADGIASIEIVKNPEQACLLVSHADDVSTAQGLASWNLGINHYVYGVTKPINETIHYGMASLGSVAITEAQFRPEYDIPLPLPAIWNLEKAYQRDPGLLKETKELHRPRKYLLTFKGSVQDTLQPYYQHRWLAAEYLFQEPDVVIDVHCKHKMLLGDLVRIAPYDNQTQANFDDLMVRSTFAFCPGGSHVTSFRFTEALSAGAIPVLLPEIVTPFSPEVDWSGCVIRVSSARIIDLPRILRAIPPKEIRQRREQCHLLYQAFLHTPPKSHNREIDSKNIDATAEYLAAALKIWHIRLEKEHRVNQIISQQISLPS